MLGAPRLLAFSLRALLLVVAIGLLWTVVAEPYSGLLAALAGPLVSDETALKAVDTRIQINHPFDLERLFEMFKVERFGIETIVVVRHAAEMECHTPVFIGHRKCDA